jgi:serine/threonine protein kinase
VVNLIVEYMDGGSLQDVVDAGSCLDEEVLADIAYQVLPPLSSLSPLQFSLLTDDRS